MKQAKQLKTWEIVLLVGLIVIIISGCAVATWYAMQLIFGDRNGNGDQGTAAVDDPWKEINRSGTLRVGVSVDYPPFEYYNPEFQVDGFDPALMKEIGKKIGLEIEFIDIAFNGLANALAVNQVDAVISAISYTPERDALADFSNVYYVGEDGILAQQAANLGPITNIEQMAPYRVGVQSGSVYYQLLQTELVNTGKMPPGNLIVYTRADEAVLDLQQNRINLVMMDLNAAESFMQSGGLVIVGIGLNPQKYVIAVKNGSTTLVEKINAALIELNNEGMITVLARQYLQLGANEVLPTPQPTVTPAPNPTATPPPPPPPSCIDAMAYVKDLNLDDNNMQNPPVMAPGQPFSKGWRIRNTGTCTWNASYFLGYSSGNVPEAQMGGQPTAIIGTVPPGANYDIYVNLVSPLTPGVYQGFWNMFNPGRQPFGQRIWVGIKVVPAPTPTPGATQTPSPNLQFSADRTSITAGQGVTFSWNVTGAKQVFFYVQGQDYRNFPVAVQGSKTEYPNYSTTYELRAIYLDDRTEIRQIRIEVTAAPPNAPKITRFTLTPTDFIFAGQCVNLAWTVEGEVSNVRLNSSQGEIWGNAPLNGSSQHCPSGTGTVTYQLEASGPGGKSNAQDAVEVLSQPATPIPTVTPAPLPPIIEYFSVTPSDVQIGQCVTISWKTGGGTNRVQLQRNGSVVLDNAPIEGNAQDCLQKQGQAVYKLLAWNPQGILAEAQSTVNVVAPQPPPNPLPGTSWGLLYLYDGFGALIAPIPGTTISLVFNDGSTLSGTAGCNNYSGSYQASGSNLSVNSNFQVGNVYCADPPGIMEQEQRYFQLLPSSYRFEILGNQINIYDGSGQLVLQFGPLAQPR